MYRGDRRAGDLQARPDRTSYITRGVSPGTKPLNET